VAVWPAVILCKTNQCLSEAPGYENWLWMELDEFFYHLLRELGVTNERRLLNFWDRVREAIDEG